MAQLGFKKGNSFSSYQEGVIYFETSTHLLKVGTGASTCEIYSGVRSASWDDTNKKLTIVNQTGTEISLDFADVASATGVTSLLATLRDDINKKVNKPTNTGSVGQVLKLADASGNTEWYTVPAQTNYTITIDSSVGGSSDTYLKKYHIYQNNSEIGVIDIPKDLVVTSGSVVTGTWSSDTFTEGANGTGKAVKLTIANQTAPVYINVADLVDVYTAASNAAEIQIAISNSNVISASIVNGSIAKTKLDSSVQSSLGKADSAVQSVSLAGGTNNGTVKLTVDGTATDNIAVTGLGSAAFTASTAYDASGAAAAVLGSSGDASTTATVYGAKAYADAKKSEVVGKSNDASTANTIYGAKAYADSVIATTGNSKADKVSGATNNNFAALDANGNLKDSGKKASDFATTAQGTKADSAIQSVSGQTAVANSSYVAVSVEASTNSTTKAVTLSSHANVTTQDVSTATSSENGLATAYDVKQYVTNSLSWLQFN